MASVRIRTLKAASSVLIRAERNQRVPIGAGPNRQDSLESTAS
jgi:hypothetical protein